MLNTLSNLFNELKAQGVSAAVVDNAACGRISNNMELLWFVYEILHDGEDNARLRSLVKSIERANRIVAAKKDDANEAIPLMLAVTCSVLEENGFLPSIFYGAEWNLKAIYDKLNIAMNEREEGGFIHARMMQGFTAEEAYDMYHNSVELSFELTDEYILQLDARLFNFLGYVGCCYNNAIDMEQVIDEFVFHPRKCDKFFDNGAPIFEPNYDIDDNYDDDLPF